MGKISDYANVLKSKLTDLFVVYQRNDGELETKNATLEQLGNAICGEQVHSDLKTDNQTIIGGINELAKDKNIADEYDDTHTYNKGDVTIYGNTLYICNTNNTTGDFDPSKWTATTVQSLIGSLSSLTTTDKSSLVGAVNEVNNRTPKIQYGYVNVGYCGANAVTTATISYSGFTTTPKIIACLDLVTSQINNTHDLTIAVNEDNVTTVSAEIDIINLSSALYAGFNWIAIGN